MTVTAKIYNAATSPIDAELARRCLVNDLTQRFRADTSPPFDIADYSTKLDVWTPYIIGFEMQARIAQSALLFHQAFTSIMNEGISSSSQVMIPADPAQSVYHFVSADDHATSPMPLVPRPKRDLLEGYKEYDEANWDGHDAEPITAETLEYARRLLKLIPETFGPPDVAPSADGSIGLEWVPESGPLQKLFLDIGPGPEWRAYWKRRNGEFGRLPGAELSPTTRYVLQKLFDDLSRESDVAVRR